MKLNQLIHLVEYAIDIKLVEEYLHQKSYDELQKFTHSLEATASAIGDTAVSIQTVKVEEMCQNHEYQNIDENIEQLILELNEINVFKNK